MLRIALTGPESTGKSTLCRQLAAHYHAPCVPEYARAYLAGRRPPYALTHRAVDPGARPAGRDGSDRAQRHALVAAPARSHPAQLGPGAASDAAIAR